MMGIMNASIGSTLWGIRMLLKQKMKGSAMTIALEGRMDASGVQALEEELNAMLPAVTRLTFDMKKLDYISSAGLRVLLSAQKTMNLKDGMVIRHVRPQVMEVFNLVGFSSLLNIE